MRLPGLRDPSLIHMSLGHELSPGVDGLFRAIMFIAK